MKKIKYFLGIVFVALFVTSCFEEVDNWYTKTSSFDGRYSVAISCEEDDEYDAGIEKGLELWIYNSAANIENEIIIDAHLAVTFDENGKVDEEGYSVKGKFKVTGDPTEFKSNETVMNLSTSTELHDGDYFLVINGHWYNPSDLDDSDVGEEFKAVHLYSRMSLVSGKITPKGATTIGGNKSDGLHMQITTYCDSLIVESYATPSNTWAYSDVPEYAWRIKAGSRKNADEMEEHWTLDGYRYTGYPEDLGTQPPIIEK